MVAIATPNIYQSINTLENAGTKIDPYDQFGNSTPISIKRAQMNTLFTLDPGSSRRGFIQLHIEAATGTKPIDQIYVTCGTYTYS
jgi:hypothetical protein